VYHVGHARRVDALARGARYRQARLALKLRLKRS
jgi:hypothetical protein